MAISRGLREFALKWNDEPAPIEPITMISTPRHAVGAKDEPGVWTEGKPWAKFAVGRHPIARDQLLKHGRGAQTVLIDIAHEIRQLAVEISHRKGIFFEVVERHMGHMRLAQEIDHEIEEDRLPIR